MSWCGALASVATAAGCAALARAALALALALALAAPAHAATAPEGGSRGGGFVVIDLPDGGGDPTDLARMSPARVEAIARGDAGIRMALTRRPGARLTLAYRPEGGVWNVRLVDGVGRLELASVQVDDATGRITASRALPVGRWPSRLARRTAIQAAVDDPRTRRLARRWGGADELRAAARLEGCCWEVDLFAPGENDDEPVVRVEVVDSTGAVRGAWTGIQIPWKMARGERMAFGGEVNRPWVWLPFFVLFALVAIDWTRLRSAWTVDVLALLALGASHEAFLRGAIDWSVPLAVPPLLWLGGHMAWVFARGIPEPSPAPPPPPPPPPRAWASRLAGVRAHLLRPVPTVLVVVLAVALAGVRIGIAVEGGNVIDVGYAGVAGARLELEGTAPWRNMPDDNPRGDTYGPANYLAYVPATLAFDDPRQHDWGVPLPAAQATSIAADLLCALLLALVGWRWISPRGAALLAAGWLACPWTVWALASGVNDALVAAPLLAAFALVPRAFARGLLVGVAAMVKFAPLVALAPLLHVGDRQRRRQALLASSGALVAVAAGLAWVAWRIDEPTPRDLRVFWERTIGFQADRGSPFSPWGLYDAAWIDHAQRAAQLLVALAALAACVVPRQRSAWQVAAGIAALVVAAQLVVTHWFYLYVPWFVGFVLVVLVAARERRAVARRAGDMLRAH